MNIIDVFAALPRSFPPPREIAKAPVFERLLASEVALEPHWKVLCKKGGTAGTFEIIFISFLLYN